MTSTFNVSLYVNSAVNKWNSAGINSSISTSGSNSSIKFYGGTCSNLIAMGFPYDSNTNGITDWVDYEVGKKYIFVVQHIYNVYEDIIEQSSYIAIVRPKELVRETEKTEVYMCDLVDCIKGNITVTENNEVIIPFFRNTVEFNCDYYVCLNSSSNESVVYTLSSLNSVFKDDSADFINIISEADYEEK